MTPKWLDLKLFTCPIYNLNRNQCKFLRAQMMIILKRLMTNTRLYLNTQYPFHPGRNESYCRTYESEHAFWVRSFHYRPITVPLPSHYRPITVPLPSRYRSVTIFCKRYPLSLTVHRPSPLLTVAHRCSPFFTVPHRSSPFLTVPHRLSWFKTIY